VYEPPSVQAILREWGEAPDRTRLDARTRWRDRRLAALRAHKASQPGP
jgi:L-gulonate 3-dehydrogenase